MSARSLHSAVHSVFPWKSFIGIFDLKQGSVVISLFALFNKIVGVFGILALLTGGTFAQVSLYVYSLATIFAILWGVRGISDEDPRTVIRYAHFFVADHLISSIWTFTFAHQVFTSPHNGDPPPTGKYQQELMQLIEQLEQQYGETRNHSQSLTGQARVQAAQEVWNFEKHFATLAILLGWFLKAFFALTLYSYALHLRHGTYAALPLAKSSSMNVTTLGLGRSQGSVSLPDLTETEEPESYDQHPHPHPHQHQRWQSHTSLSAAGPASATEPEEQWWPPSGVDVPKPRPHRGSLDFGGGFPSPPLTSGNGDSNGNGNGTGKADANENESRSFLVRPGGHGQQGSRRSSHVYQDSVAVTVESLSSTYATPAGSSDRLAAAAAKF